MPCPADSPSLAHRQVCAACEAEWWRLNAPHCLTDAEVAERLARVEPAWSGAEAVPLCPRTLLDVDECDCTDVVELED